MWKEVVVVYFETLSLLTGLRKTFYPSVRTAGLQVESWICHSSMQWSVDHVMRKSVRISLATENNCHCSVIPAVQDYVTHAGPKFMGSNQERNVSVQTGLSLRLCGF
jgi:hypothetical protein